MSTLWYEGVPVKVLSRLRAAAPDVSLLNEQLYFDTVESLDLSETNLLIVPPWLKRMRNLKYLDLSHNHIDTVYGKDLPEQLQTLNLLDNDIEVLNFDDSYLPYLYAMNVSQNLLTQVPIGLEHLVRLREVFLSRNEIRNLDNARFPESLTHLHLTSNNLDYLPGDKVTGLDKLVVLAVNLNNLRSIPSWVVELPQLRQIYLLGNDIEDWEFEAIMPTTLQTDFR